MGKKIQAYKLKARKPKEKRTLGRRWKDLDVNTEVKVNVEANENSSVSADSENKSFVDPPYTGSCNQFKEES